MKFKKGPEPSCYSWARKQRYKCGRCFHPRPVMTQIPAIPTLPDIPNLGEIRTVGGGPQEGIVMPLSVTDRVTLVRNNMYENYLQKSTQKLQDEIHHTMKMYSVEKQQLLKQLATLRHDMSELRISDNDTCARHKVHNGSHQYSEPLVARGSEGHTLPPIIKTGIIGRTRKSREKKDTADDDDDKEDDKDEEVEEKLSRSDTQLSDLSDENKEVRSFESSDPELHGEFKLFPDRRSQKKGKTSKDASTARLPQIKEEPPRPHWYSGSNSHSVKQKDHSLLTSLPQIKEMRDISETSYNIPSVKDPIRCEISIPTKPSTKKVHFSGSNSVRETHDDLDWKTREHYHAKPGISLPQISKKKFQMSKPSKKKGSRQFQQLPSLKEASVSEVGPSDILARGSKGMEEWKSVYVNIHDPEERTKTLGDILYAVRVRMRENEQKLMYGHKPTEDKTDNTLCDYLLAHKEDQDGIRRTRKKMNPYKKGQVPSHTAERLHRRSNAVQLQNYLKKLSRQRRMIEHMEGEEYRLTHIVGHQHLQEAAQKSVQ